MNQDLKSIKFTYNWNNKLKCNYFTTMRLANPEKYKVGNQHKILFLENGVYRDYGIGEIVAIRNLRLHQLNIFICGLDTGYSVDQTKQIIYKMYKNRIADINHADFNLVLYRKIKKQPSQKTLF